MSPPPPSVLSAFNLTHLGPPLPLSGGQGDSYHLSHKVVLKPTLDVSETDFMCGVQAALVSLKNPAYRIALPIPVSQPRSLDQLQPSGSEIKYVSEGWTATHFLPGIEDVRLGLRMVEILPAIRAMHSDLRRLVPSRPATVDERTDRWAWADRVAFDEVRLMDVPKVGVEMVQRLSDWIERLEKCRRAIPSEQECKGTQDEWQLIHGDCSGNILSSPHESDSADVKDKVESGLSPAIIDFSPYWRPVRFAEGIVVADGITWQDGGLEMVRQVGLDRDAFGVQMLLRAVVFRVVTYCIDVDMDFVDRNLGQMNVEKAVGIVEGLVERFDRESK